MSATTRGGVFINNARSTTSATDGRAAGYVSGRNHMRLLISAALLVALFGIGGTGIDLVAAPPQSSSVPVKFFFADGGTHKIASDLLGLYENGKGVSAVIDPNRNGELIIYSVKSGKIAQRRFMLTFDDCIGTCVGVPPMLMPTGAQLIAGVRRPVDGVRLTGGLLAMPVNVPGYRAGFKAYLGSINSVEWTLCMTPSDSGNVCQNSTSTGSTPAHILRTSSAAWRIWADPGPRPVLAPGETDTRGGGELFTQTSSSLGTTYTNQGEYAMPFSMTVQCVVPANCPAPAP